MSRGLYGKTPGCGDFHPAPAPGGEHPLAEGLFSYNRPARNHCQETTLPSIGFPELLLILGIALLIFGPRKLPELGSALGRTIKEFRKGMKEASSSTSEEEKK